MLITFAFDYVFYILPKIPAFTNYFLIFFLRILYTRAKGNAKILLFKNDLPEMKGRIIIG